MVFHLNGQLVLPDQARISPLDRGFLFGDGIYEGLRAIHQDRGSRPARIVGWQLHVDRMNAGLREAGIDFDASSLDQPTHDLLNSNGMTNAFVYWQVTAGTPSLVAGDPPRSRVKPKGLTPTVFGYCTPQPPLDAITSPPTKKVITCRDVRWEMGHVKSVSLMGNLWAARKAEDAGADEVIFVRGGDAEGRGGIITEGLATNLVFVFEGAKGAGSGPQGAGNRGVEIVTPSLDSAPMLSGVTRSILLRLVPEIVQRPVRADEVASASEVMLIGTTTMVTSVVSIDGRVVGEGIPGPVARRLHDLLLQAIRDCRDDKTASPL